jgi:pyruvate ferredoxin oxidoreductase alpha subunit
MVLAMNNVPKVTKEMFSEFAKLTGRKYSMVEEYKCEDADCIAIVLGSAFGTNKEAVDQLRKEGKKVGVAMPRLFRPWPIAELAKLMKGKKTVIVMDKHLSVGAYGPMFPEIVAAALENDSIPKMFNYIYGLGGADTMVSDFVSAFKEVESGKAKRVNFLGVKE